MTRARAPGKIVLSGAYAVLGGAPAIVAAVSRWVTADTTRPAAHSSAEVLAALGPGEAHPALDVSELFDGERKLGLGSSAAIVAASLAALRAAPSTSPDGTLGRAALDALFEAALAAHRTAQGGGSGVDVAAACYGGVLAFWRTAAGPSVEPVSLPSGLHLEVWAAPTAARTSDMLARTARLAADDPARHAELLAAQAGASEAALAAVRRGDGPALVEALDAQCAALAALGDAAGAPIVTAAVRALRAAARDEGGVVLPAGAGGGDVALFVGPAAPSPALRGLAELNAHARVTLAFGARGVHLVPDSP